MIVMSYFWLFGLDFYYVVCDFLIESFCINRGGDEVD